MPRWLVLTLGVVLAAAALFALATVRAPDPGDHEIDARSRERLEDVLRREGGDPR